MSTVDSYTTTHWTLELDSEDMNVLRELVALGMEYSIGNREEFLAAKHDDFERVQNLVECIE